MTTLTEVLDRLNSIEQRLTKLEATTPPSFLELPEPSPTPPPIYMAKPPATPAAAAEETPAPDNGPIHQTKPPKQGAPAVAPVQESGPNLLGIIAVICFALAALLLVKFAIDSYWLTPARQIFLAVVVGLVMSFSPFFLSLSDKRYASQLPAAGLIILNLAIYAAVFYHKLIPPLVGIISISGVTALALFLVRQYKQDLFAIIAVVGVYFGAFAFQNILDSAALITVFLILWALVFVRFSILVRWRQLIVIAAYLALGLVGVRAFGVPPESLHEVVAIQTIQFLIFALGIALYSSRNRERLTQSESLILLPVVLFFYGQIYFFLDKIQHRFAFAFSILFPLFLAAAYQIGRRRLAGALASRDMVTFAILLIFAHSIFLVEFNDAARVGSVLIALFGYCLLGSSRTTVKPPPGVWLITGLMAIYSYLHVLVGDSNFSNGALVLLGLAFAALLFWLNEQLDKSATHITLSLANLQMMTSIWRMGEYTGPTLIAPIWMLYSLAVLIFASAKRSRTMAQQSVAMVCVGFFRFLFFQFPDLPIGSKIVALFILGGIIFVTGYLYRRIDRQLSQS
jgi:uncharacterized membrane protein